MQRREWDTKLYDIAEAQLGYFSTAQARDAGINPIRLLQLVKSEDIERVSRGVYRLTRFPISPLGQYMEATLWPQVRRPDMWAVLSHESALSLYELSDASPSKVHITLPATVRIRRAVPRHLTLHRAALDPRDVKIVEGIRVTTPERTIYDVHANHIGHALVRQAIMDGRRTGYLTVDQAHRLQRELLGDEATAARRSQEVLVATWTLEKAKNGFSEVVRRALDHQPQLVTRGRGDDAVVVLAKEDYERLVAPQNFVDFLRNSPMAEAVAAGELGDPSAHDPFARPRDMGRSIDLA